MLRCVEVWHKESVEVPQFEATSRASTFMPGSGCRAESGPAVSPHTFPMSSSDANFPRAPIAAREGLHAAFGFPILLGGDVLGVMEFFSHEITAARPGPARHDGYHRQPDRPVHRAQAGRRCAAPGAGGAGARYAGGDAGRADGLDCSTEVNQPLTAVIANANASLSAGFASGDDRASLTRRGGGEPHQSRPTAIAREET